MHAYVYNVPLYKVNIWLSRQLYIASGSANWFKTSAKQFGDIYQEALNIFTIWLRFANSRNIS